LSNRSLLACFYYVQQKRCLHSFGVILSTRADRWHRRFPFLDSWHNVTKGQIKIRRCIWWNFIFVNGAFGSRVLFCGNVVIDPSFAIQFLKYRWF